MHNCSVALSGSAPTIEFSFDATNNFVLGAAFGVDKALAPSPT